MTPKERKQKFIELKKLAQMARDSTFRAESIFWENVRYRLDFETYGRQLLKFGGLLHGIGRTLGHILTPYGTMYVDQADHSPEKRAEFSQRIKRGYSEFPDHRIYTAHLQNQDAIQLYQDIEPESGAPLAKQLDFTNGILVAARDVEEEIDGREPPWGWQQPQTKQVNAKLT